MNGLRLPVPVLVPALDPAIDRPSVQAWRDLDGGPSFPRLIRRLVAILACALGAGCASLPHNVQRTPSSAIAPDPAGALAIMVGKVVPPGNMSGFALMPVSSVAYETRLALARRAEHSIDVQYYILHNDTIGLGLLRELRAAALRGVRVRVLVDDLYTAGEDRLLSDLATTPNFEIRLFNPFVNGRFGFYARLILSADESERIDHRMHNKLFIADGVAAISGGRNIADEYFMTSAVSNFIDLDVFMAGPVAGDLDRIFDTYWNSSSAYPLASIVALPEDRSAAQSDFLAAIRDLPVAPRDVPTADFERYYGLPEQIAGGRLAPLELARVDAFADPVDKAQGADNSSLAGTVTGRVIAAMNQARRNVIIVSPYFVPGDGGVAMMEAGRKDGGHIIVVTNSLASTDEPAVHGSYAPFRHALLKAGVELRELSPHLTGARGRMGDFGTSTGSLHAKVIAIDDDVLYVGSMNLDPRSGHKNTELGLLIYSKALVAEVQTLMDDQSLYHLQLSPAGDIQWVVKTVDGDIVYDAEPETTWLQRAKAWLLSIIVPAEET